MPDYKIAIGDATYNVHSDSELSDTQAYQAALSQHQDGSTASQRANTPGTGLALASGLVPIASRAAAAAAINPTLPTTMATTGRVIGGLAPIIASIAGAIKTGNPMALAGMAGSAGGAWGGGGTGWFTGKMLQDVANPLSRRLTQIAPNALRAGGASGVTDLAQMAEPQRRDIGFMGIGPSVSVPGAQPPLLNLLLQKLTRIGS